MSCCSQVWMERKRPCEWEQNRQREREGEREQQSECGSTVERGQSRKTTTQQSSPSISLCQKLHPDRHTQGRYAASCPHDTTHLYARPTRNHRPAVLLLGARACLCEYILRALLVCSMYGLRQMLPQWAPCSTRSPVSISWSWN